MNYEKNSVTGKKIRQLILDLSFQSHEGHIGSALSVSDIIAVIFGEILHISNIRSKNRDRFILSKGHAALALYCALYLKGLMNKRTLETYCSDGSLLGVHPEAALTGIEFSTGSLGQGLSFGVGTALAADLLNKSYHTYVLVSDAECNEGSIWEAVMFAAHNRLSNLTVIVDLNGQQAFGYTRDVLQLKKLSEKFKIFGWNAFDVNGHDEKKLATMLRRKTSKPKVIIAHTTFGKGVSFMESQIKWHYQPLGEQEYSIAVKELK
ncbi:MAG: Transketolase, beta subunit [Candidatus Gottesmanbacteria bacterium GW2011_GWA1_43_11]|uniref:Transketolase, beta subunit n=1 Tax=Candidatus Gottesmanbacteria bacterium GW2011_GWA1_43_11 TaxID=1618436 RepID=A0A0G1CLE3_9BACT|nr:MAG: Transketolase, beta subunit [Candidatus Gottesmanbacteria bacterium GW2011_GWA1_43_11]